VGIEVKLLLKVKLLKHNQPGIKEKIVYI
jgi:hypothetical protein